MTELFENGKRALAAQGFSMLVGAELIAYEPGRAEIHIPIADKHKQHHGFVHGGALSYAADITLTLAGASALGGGGVVTSEFKINYLRPALGQLLIARATVAYAGKTQAVCRCDIFAVKDGQEKLCAIAQGTIVRMNEAPKQEGVRG